MGIKSYILLIHDYYSVVMIIGMQVLICQVNWMIIVYIFYDIKQFLNVFSLYFSFKLCRNNIFITLTKLETMACSL